MRFASWTLALVALLAAASARPAPAADDDEQTLREAGLATDGPALVEFFRTRAHVGPPEPGRLQELVRRFGDGSLRARNEAAAELVAWGPLAVPALRHAANDLDDAGVSDRARRCLQWVEGPSSTRLPEAAARLLAARKPEGAAEALLAYLPFADNEGVGREVLAALAAVAFPGGKPDPVLVRGLADPVPIRRAAAGVALCRADRPEQFPAVRKLLKDPKPSVRMRAALALARANDAEAIPVLIGVLADVPTAERRQVEEFLQELAGEWAPAGAGGEDEIARRIRRDAWAAWWRHTDGPALLAALRKRTLQESDRAKVRALVRRLGDESFTVRERSVAELASLGPLALPLLREALKDHDKEIARRAADCIRRIEREPANHLPMAAVRMLTLRKPEGAAEALLAYLPFAEDESLAGEVRSALAGLARREGKPEPALVKGLADRMPLVRAAAAEALAKGGGMAARPAVRKLLTDPDPEVRMQTAVALAVAREREAVPVLIDVVGVLPADQAAPALETLYQLAGDRAPEAPSGDGAAARKKCRAAWAAWWKEHGVKVDLAKLDATQGWLGYTLLCENHNGNMGRVVEIGRDGKVRWSIENIPYPVDAWVLPGNRVLIAEYNGRKVTERDRKGKILWHKDNLPGNPVNVQRLPNGHTFIATDNQLLEVDRAGKEVLTVNTLGAITAAYKTRGGRIVCLTQAGQCVTLDGSGKQVKSFPSNRNAGWTSGLDLLANGRILITQPNNNKVTEVDREGKIHLEVDAPQVTTATALPNGHILAASYHTARVWEIDRKGKTVWEHKDGANIFRARRR